MDPSTVKWLGTMVLLGPLLGAVAAGALGPVRLRARSHWAAIAGVAFAFICSTLLFVQLPATSGIESHAPGSNAAHVSDSNAVHAPGSAAARRGGPPAASITVPVYDWLPRSVAYSPHSGWFHVEYLYDGLTAIMLCMVTFISLLVVIYSRDYMRDHDHPERGYERFFAYLALFVFSMCILVLGGNFLLLYLGWEAVGLCSYLLIGFYYWKPEAAAAAKKAFLVNRIGDFGFGLGILLIYLTFGTLQYDEVFRMIAQNQALSGPLETGRLTAIALLLLCGAVGKSAQLPLYVWLPDAMEGPSPVSALIHAATMVTAGVYMMVRCGAIFAASESALLVVACIGAGTALFAATIALVQTDMKRILAYSTISQLGYMFLAVGVYAAESAIFHLFTHAFFKALLFLTAGSVMHAMGGVIDLRRFGGLRKALPHTFITMAIGGAALAGVPLMSGFFSKDEIIHHAFAYHWVFGAMGLLTAVLTAFYTGRMFFLAFYGEYRAPEGVHPHESGPWVRWPLTVLALGAATAGFVGVDFVFGRPLHGLLAPAAAPFHAVLGAPHESGGFLAAYGLMILSGALSLAGIGAAWFVFVENAWIATLTQYAFPKLYQLLWEKYRVDEFYQAWVADPLWQLGRLFHWLDDYVVDGLVWLTASIPKLFGLGARSLQRGALQGYGLTMMLGMMALLMLLLGFAI